MAFREFVFSFFRVRSALLLLTALALCGCAVVGPRSIAGGRRVYAEVINRTQDEEILNVIVRQRYDQTFGMILVASVTANLRFSAEVGTNIGIGDSGDYAGNLVPLSAGVAYEDNPTISYVPLSGEDFNRRMLSPVSVEEWLLLGRGIRHPGNLFALAIHRINGLRNPLLGEASQAPELLRFLELYDRLRRANVLDTVADPETQNGTKYLWDIHDYEAHVDSVRELLDLIGIQAKPDGSPILLPLRSAVGSSPSALHVQMRSAQEVLRVMGAGVEIPSPHLEAGIIEPLVSAHRFITIRSSEKRPDDATVRVRFRDHWFYIDATDTESKRAFAFLRTFISMRMADPGAVQAPVLTVPVN